VSEAINDGGQLVADSHGVQVFVRRWEIDAPRGRVLIAHGASEHSGRYDRFAKALNAAGYDAVALDHRGHGLTGKSTGVGATGPGGADAVITDLHELRAWATEWSGDAVPTYVFGHSLGSLIAFAYLTRYSAGLAGGVLCGFPADPDNTAELAALLEGAIAGGMRDAPFDALAAYNVPYEPARTAFDWLSRDEDEVDRYVADPLCGDGNPLTYGYIGDLFAVIAPARDSVAAISCPVFVIAGDQDESGSHGAFPTALAGALSEAGVPTELKLYAGARHEILNETNRDEVTQDVIDWLGTVGAAASG
jgi:alpha-beta hydrolase superfamily lysophospholipase